MVGGLKFVENTEGDAVGAWADFLLDLAKILLTSRGLKGELSKGVKFTSAGKVGWLGNQSQLLKSISLRAQ